MSVQMKRPSGRKKGGSGTTSTGSIYIITSTNNTKITVTDQNGRVVAWSSGGKIGLKNTKKSTPDAAERAAKDAAGRVKLKGMSTVKIKFKGYGPGREGALRGIMASGISVSQIEDITPIKHGGNRERAEKRN
jgi:small subunit ribosomal protein S11